MASSTRSIASTERGDVGLNVGVAVLLTALVVVDWWGLAVPALPPMPQLVLAVVGGVGAGIALQVADEREILAPFQERTAVFVLVVVGALAVGFTLFPNGLPVAVEIGVFALLWAATATRGALYLSGDGTGPGPEPN